jgi:adenosyl cobinamide kinase/adenosyl cobinamide phosphate guanylyltransferase
MTLVLGGARSGKSLHAERLIEACPAPWLYLATAQAWDDEMRERVALHRSRRSADWITRDVPIDLAEAVAAATGPVLVDCLTLWLTNLILSEADIEAASAALIEACARHLAALLPLPSAPEDAAVVRWPRAMPQYLVGHLERAFLPRRRASPGAFLGRALLAPAPPVSLRAEAGRDHGHAHLVLE